MQIFFKKTNGNRNCSTTEKKTHTSLRMEMFIQYKHRRQCGRYHYRWKTLVITGASVFDISIMKRDKIIQIHQWLIKYNCIPPFLQVTSGVEALWVSVVITPHSNIDARCVQASAPLYSSGCPELDSGLLFRPVKNPTICNTSIVFRK